MVVIDLPLASLIVVTQDLTGLAVEMDGAGAASGDSATEFRSREPEFVAKIPEQRHRRVAIECLRLAVDTQSEHNFLPVHVRPLCGLRSR